MNAMKKSFQNLLYYPSAILGIFVVFLLVATAVYAMVKIPYNEAIRLWQAAAERGHLYAFIELAKHYEHKLRDIKTALQWTRAALICARSELIVVPVAGVRLPVSPIYRTLLAGALAIAPVAISV